VKNLFHISTIPTLSPNLGSTKVHGAESQATDCQFTKTNCARIHRCDPAQYGVPKGVPSSIDPYGIGGSL
jgi:hypothetical protein